MRTDVPLLADDPRAARTAWTVTGLLALVSAHHHSVRHVPFFIVPVLERDLAMTSTEIGLLQAAFLWVYALCSPLAGWVGDRLSRRRVVIGTLVAWSVLTLLGALAPSGAALISLRALLGVSMAFYIPASMAILADAHARSTRGRAVALLGVGSTLGPIATGYIAAHMAGGYGWRAVFVAYGALGVVLGLLLLRRLPDVAPGAREAAPPGATLPPLATLRALLRIPTFVGLGLVSGITAVAVWMLVTWLPSYVYESFDTTLESAGALGALANEVPPLVGFILGGILSDRFGAARPAGRLRLFIIFLTLSIPCTLLFRGAGGLATVLAAAALWKLLRMVAESNWHPLLYEVVPPEMRSTATGVTNAFNCILGGAGAYAVGYCREHDYLDLQDLFGLQALLLTLAVGTLVVVHLFLFERDAAALRSRRQDGRSA